MTDELAQGLHILPTLVRDQVTKFILTKVSEQFTALEKQCNTPTTCMYNMSVLNTAKVENYQRTMNSQQCNTQDRVESLQRSCFNNLFLLPIT